MCAFESTIVYDSDVEIEDNYEYDLFDYYNGEIEKDDVHDEISPSEQESTPLGRLVIDSVNNIMHSLTRTLYTNFGYYVDAEHLYAVDCSYYIKQVLKDLPEHYDALPKSSNSENTALAKDYYDHFKDCPTDPKQGDLWQRVKNITKVQPGDIIAYKYTDNKDTTGHVMVAYSVATKSTCKCKHPKEYKNQHWLWVSDSANSGHREDTRNKKGPYASHYEYTAYYKKYKKGSGVGIGKMWLNTGSKPFYRWSKCCGTAHKDIKIAIGRPIKVE